MVNPIDVVSSKLGIPKWWVEAIAIEYTDCREFAVGEEIWTFNFEKISINELENALKNHKVILHDPIYHNINPEVFKSRFIYRMVSSIPVPLSEDMEDIIPEGLVSKFYCEFQGNGIKKYDPKLSFSSYCQIFDNGNMYQWKIAESINVDGQNYSKCQSDFFDLEPLNDMEQELRLLQNSYIKVGKKGNDEFRKDVEDYYRRLDDIRRPLLKDLIDYHKGMLKSNSDFPKVLKVTPPILSHFERFTVSDNELCTKFYAETIFYRGCYEHAREAENLVNSIKSKDEYVNILDEIYEERATAIILGVVCFEAFLNGLGFDYYPEIWKHIEKLDLKKKCKVYYSLSNKDASLFNKGKEPFKSLIKLIDYRNDLVHYKRKYHKSLQDDQRYITSTEQDLSRDFVRDLPDKLKEVILEFCKINSTPIPQWLDPQPNLGWIKNRK